MNVCVTKVEMCNHNERLIPGVVTLTFSNGEKATYERSGDETATASNQLAQFNQPNYDLPSEIIDKKTFEDLGANIAAQLRSLEKQYQSAKEEAERLFQLEKANINDYFERRCFANDQLYSTLSKQILGDYESLKKKIDGKKKALYDPAGRLKIMIEWLRVTEVKELRKAADMLELDADYIVKRVNSTENKWDCYLSHVQKKSADVCRNIKTELQKKGISSFIDKSADRIDKHGLVNGVVDSSLFILVMTTDYFDTPYCIFEYCIAVVAGMPMLILTESDQRYGGGPIGSFKLEGVFKHVLNHENIEIHRAYWDAFITRLHERIQETVKSGLERSIGNSLQTSEAICSSSNV